MKRHFGLDSGVSLEKGRKMKVKDLIKQLSEYDGDEKIVMKNLSSAVGEVVTTMRVYQYKGKLFLDGYGKDA